MCYKVWLQNNLLTLAKGVCWFREVSKWLIDTLNKYKLTPFNKPVNTLANRNESGQATKLETELLL